MEADNHTEQSFTKRLKLGTREASLAPRVPFWFPFWGRCGVTGEPGALGGVLREGLLKERGLLP